MANLRVDKITSTETFETTGSVQFSLGGSDATRDRLTIASNTDFTTSGDFTIEAWIYPFNRVTGGTANSIFGIGDYDSSTGFLFYVKSDGLLSFYTGSDENNTTFKINSSTWHHVALVRSSQIITIYADGKFLASYSYDNTFSGLAIIGGNSTNGSDSIGGFSGHISNVRYVNGRALYTENFKPPMRELEVVPGTVLLACQSKSDATLEKTGKTIVPHNTAVASEFTPGLLTPVPKAGAGSAITGSVEFSGSSGGHLKITEENDFDLGADDFTIEYWYNEGNDERTERRTLYMRDSAQQFIVGHTNDNSGRIFFQAFDSSGNTIGGSAVTSADASNPTGQRNYWRHLAVVRNGTTATIYLDGVASGSRSYGTTAIRGDQNDLYIGQDPASSGREFRGFISNLRIVKGTALYTGDFIPPTRELKKVPGTVLLCCQDSNNPTQEATGKTISLNGIYTYDTVVNSGITTTPVSSDFTPQVGDDRKVTFEGVTKINSNAYFYLPTGDTVTRNTRSGRGLFGGGDDPSATNSIDYVNINSTGNAQDFGDLTEARDKIAAAGSSTRGLFAGGDPSSNTIAYVTLATTGNALNFGDLPYDGWGTGAASNDIRWLNFGDYSTNRISYVTMSTLGDAQDFGDLLTTGPYHKGCGSSVRAIIYPESGTSDIQFLTFASTGNAVSFGEKLDSTQAGFGAASDSTRAIRFGGRDTPGGNTINAMGYVTIASTGDARDFGDLTSVSKDGDATSNSIRAVHNIGNSSSVTNAIDYVTIQTTGNAKNFGDLTTQTRTQGGTTSDSHGGVG